MDKNSVKNIPEIGKKYHFFDDGKCGPNKHYVATVREIITTEEAKKRYFKHYAKNVIRPLYEIWKEDAKNHDYLYAQETDYFISCDIPKYDKNPVWFVRTKDGGWFSIDIFSFWQSGRLDVTGNIYKEIKESFDNDTWEGRYDELSKTEIID